MKMVGRRFALLFAIVFLLVLLSLSSTTARKLPSINKFDESQKTDLKNLSSENPIVTDSNDEIEEIRNYEEKDKSVKILNEMKLSDSKKSEKIDDESEVKSENIFGLEHEIIRSGRNRRWSWGWPFQQKVEIVTLPPCPPGQARSAISIKCEDPGAQFVHGPCPEGQRKDSHGNCRQNLQ